MQLGLDPSLGAAGHGMVPALQGGGCTRPRPCPTAALPSPDCNGRDPSARSPWLPPPSPPGPCLPRGVPDDPLPLPQGGLKGTLRAVLKGTWHISPCSPALRFTPLPAHERRQYFTCCCWMPAPVAASSPVGAGGAAPEPPGSQGWGRGGGGFGVWVWHNPAGGTRGDAQRGPHPALHVQR